MKFTGLIAPCLAAVSVSVAHAAEFKAEALKQPAPADSVAADIAKTLAPTAVKVTEDGAAVCEIWLCKQWNVKAGFKPTFQVLYPFEVGELIGVVRYAQREEDFREQRIRSGVYTLRYAYQPQDGNHIGTSDTRDFLVLLPAAADTKPARLDLQKMYDLSSKVSKSPHPAILSMLATFGKVDSLPAMRHDEDRNLWSLRVQGQAKAGEKTENLTIEFVVEGHAAE